MKKAIGLALAIASLAAVVSGCAYGGVGASGTDKVVIARNDAFLFGALRKVFVCKITDNGLASCAESESP